MAAPVPRLWLGGSAWDWRCKRHGGDMIGPCWRCAFTFCQRDGKLNADHETRHALYSEVHSSIQRRRRAPHLRVLRRVPSWVGQTNGGTGVEATREAGIPYRTAKMACGWPRLGATRCASQSIDVNGEGYIQQQNGTSV